jgi:hypothetical protein
MFPTTIEDYTIRVENGVVTSVACNHCATLVKFEQPSTSNDPGDVHITPDHACTDLPKTPAVVTVSEPVIVDAKTDVVMPPSDFANTIEPVVVPAPADPAPVDPAAAPQAAIVPDQVIQPAAPVAAS